MRKQNAFTLAEVLITLTIIGVIAAITIPNLMQSYKKHQVEIGVKEAYTILSNAIKMSETENGDAGEWNFTAKNIQFPQNIIPYLKVTKDCGYDNNNHCILSFTGLGKDSGVGYGSMYKFILSNGMSVGLLPIEYFSAIYVDINGKNKGRSIIGEDIFVFSLLNKSYFKNSSTIFWAGIPNASSGTTPNLTATIETLMNSDAGNCNYSAGKSGSFPSGSQCAAVIAKNGWKIPDDYPVKKF